MIFFILMCNLIMPTKRTPMTILATTMFFTTNLDSSGSLSCSGSMHQVWTCPRLTRISLASSSQMKWATTIWSGCFGSMRIWGCFCRGCLPRRFLKVRFLFWWAIMVIGSMRFGKLVRVGWSKRFRSLGWLCRVGWRKWIQWLMMWSRRIARVSFIQRCVTGDA